MSLWSRFRNLFRAEAMNSDLDEEMSSHLQEAVRNGRSPEDARRAFGNPLLHRESTRDLKVIPWLDSLRADFVFGWRQLKKSRMTSAAAILSLALGIGSCTAAFRLIDALLFRPLPISTPERLFLIGREGVSPGGEFRLGESCEYPLFVRLRDAVKDRADLVAVSYADRADITFASDNEMEKAQRQYVSGDMFRIFGLQPAAGRLLTADDDRKPASAPYAVLSYDYWNRRFGRDANVVGRTFRMGTQTYEVIGVLAEGFTGTEPGIAIDVFLPAMMHAGVTRSDWSWFRALAMMKPGVSIDAVRPELAAVSSAFAQERASSWRGQTKRFIDNFLNQTLVMQPASSGISATQTTYRPALVVLGLLVALVLLIACANVANLMSAQAAARAREMALRVSIGAGRWRLIQLVMVEGVLLAAIAATTGSIFAAWAAPFVVSMINHPDNPARLALPVDWRVIGFGFALALTVTLLFGLAPAVRASAVEPVSALKGGNDPHSRNRLMRILIGVQVAFCFVVLFLAGLFNATFQKLSEQSTGFSSERLLTLDTVAVKPQLPEMWDQVAQHLRTLPGVESVALAGWPLLGGNGWNGFIWVDGRATEVLAYFLGVSPGWTETMGIRLLDGRDLYANDVSPGAALVNQAFVKQCFGGTNPLGKWFEKESGDGVTRIRFQVVGIVADARYRNMREPISPTAYVSWRPVDASGALIAKGSGTFIVRTTAENPIALAAGLRKAVPEARPEFRVSNIRTQLELNQSHTVRERLVAALAMFFGVVALLLAGVGLYGVLNYSVIQRTREIGIRIAIGARSMPIVRLVGASVVPVIAAGAAAGVLLGMATVKYIESLLYQVRATDFKMFLLPGSVLLAVALAAAMFPLLRALRIDPSQTLRSE